MVSYFIVLISRVAFVCISMCKIDTAIHWNIKNVISYNSHQKKVGNLVDKQSWKDGHAYFRCVVDIGR